MNRTNEEANLVFSETLIAKAQPYLEAQAQKPFLQGLLNGDLLVDRFEYWLKVDYPYLINLAKVQALGIVKANGPEAMWFMLEELKITKQEMADHKSHADRIGLPHVALTSHRMGPLKYSYTRHQLATAYHGTLGEILAAILPCKWGYGEVSRTLVRQKRIEPDNPYKDWFDVYTVDDGTLQPALNLLDREASACSESRMKKMEEIFMISVQHETMLWDEYYNMGIWETH